MGEKKKPEGVGHVALYRKYRSKSLDEIVGQEHITKTLSNAITNGKLSHAYLFTGPRGTGKTSIARILAHQINNLPYKDEATHLDIIEIDAASNRRIDDIRDLRDKVHITPVSAPYKVYIIDEVHMLTNESFNALLKTLEEPPEHVIFILATTEVHKLPATIISRTQRHTFRLIPPEKVKAHLKNIAEQEGVQIDDTALALLAEHGGGSFRDSISLLDQIRNQAQPITADSVEHLLGIAPQESLRQLLAAIQSGDTTMVLSNTEALFASGLTASSIAEQLIRLLREEAKSQPAIFHANLMSDLLEVPSSQYQQLKLETVLLQATLAHGSTTREEGVPKTTHQAPVSQPTINAPVKQAKAAHQEIQKPSANKKGVPQPENDTPDTKNTKEIPPIAIEQEWPTLLGLIKEKNNSLYTVLRLAHVTFEQNTLQLAFQFSFHQKRVDEVKNKALIAEVVQTQLHITPEVVSVLDKNLITSPIVPATPFNDAHASLISSVQDIMGGGEVVHV